MSIRSVPDAPPVVIALSRTVLADISAGAAAHRRVDLGRRLDSVADVAILGVDLLDPRAGDRADTPTDPAAETIAEPTAEPTALPHLDPSIAAIILSRFTSRVGLVVAAAPQRDHPYNLARRIATLDHATAGRIGLAVAITDPAATPGSPWTDAAPADAAADAVVALRELWRSFPADAVIADRRSGVFTESERIVAVDHRGAFDITGPLQVPSGPQLWPPVIAWGSAAPQSISTVADLVVAPGDPAFSVHQPTTAEHLHDLLDTLPPRPRATSATLRGRLGLPVPTPPATGRAVFAAPASTRTGVATHG